MRLETENGPVLENPSAEQLRETLVSLGGAAGSFAILTRQDEPLAYLQTSGEKDSFFVEYREGDKQFRAANESLTLEETAAIFQDYLAGGSRWLNLVEWTEDAEEVAGSEPRWVVPVLFGVVLLLVIAGICLYKCMKH